MEGRSVVATAMMSQGAAPAEGAGLLVAEAGGVTSPGDGAAVEYDYRRETPMTFGDAVLAVEQSIALHGFAVRTIHDIQATLAAKGFQIKPIRIYEIEGSPAAFASAGVPGIWPSGDSRFATLMPCRINVFMEGDRVVITALRPTLLCQVYPDAGLDALAGAVEKAVLEIVDDAVDG
jgi:uncharacterized protein (DUF302 family)